MSTSPPGVDPVEVAAPAVECSNVVCWHVSSIVAGCEPGASLDSRETPGLLVSSLGLSSLGLDGCFLITICCGETFRRWAEEKRLFGFERKAVVSL